jgi:hypothetical protein
MEVPRCCRKKRGVGLQATFQPCSSMGMKLEQSFRDSCVFEEIGDNVWSSSIVDA